MKKHRRVMRHVNPHAILVGYSGKFGCNDHLFPLRMSRKYKNILEQEESERNEKILQISQLIQKYKNLSSIIDNLKKENKNNENSQLLLEFDQEKNNYRKRLLNLESKLDKIPDNLNKSMQEIFNKTARHKCSNKNVSFLKRKRNTVQETVCGSKKRVMNKQKNQQSFFNVPVVHGIPTTCTRRVQQTADAAKLSSSSLFGSVESKVQVRDETSTIRTVSIDLFSSGENLLRVLHRQFGEEANDYTVFLESKKICKTKSLWEQGVIHGCILDLKIENDRCQNSGTIDQKENNRAMDEPLKENLPLPEENVSEDEDIPEKNSYFGSVKSQLLIKDCNSRVETISIDLFSNGRNLERVLRSEFGGELNSYNVVFGSKKVVKKKSLYEQGITHGATLELSVRLDGGMERQEQQLDTSKECKSPNTTDFPEKWKKIQVGNWIDDICEEFEIEEADVYDLKTLNGKGLNKLSKEDWIRRSPKQGDLFYNMWMDLKKEKSSGEPDSSELSVPPEEKSCVTVPEEKLSLVTALSDSPASEGGNTEAQANESSLKGQLEKRDHFNDLGDSISVDQLVNSGETAIRAEGSIVCIRGICCGKSGSKIGKTILLRDHTKGTPSVFNELKIDICPDKANKQLKKNAVKKLLKKISLGTHVAVLGRVEKLDQDNLSEKDGFKAFKFKLVVDSDDHGLVYTETRVVQLSRQQSQPSCVQFYPAIVDGKTLDVGDRIAKTNKRVFCRKTASYDNIKEFVVAFKNSFDGDIFVGVEADGIITGMEGILAGQFTTWREEMGKTIGNILPATTDSVSFCESDEEARSKIGKECFISVMELGDCKNKAEKISVIARIHVPKGISVPVYFSTQKDVNAFVRVGAETKGIVNFQELASRLESLSCRKIQPIADKELYIKEQVDKTFDKKTKVHREYKVFKTIGPESHNREFKMIFGNNPVKKIVEEYVTQYCCGFLNSNPGIIYCGVQEDEKSKEGRVIGMVIPSEQRIKLAETSFTVLSDFYPPVHSNLVTILFPAVLVPSDWVLKYPAETHGVKSGKCVLLRGSPYITYKKWANFIKVTMPELICRLIRVETDSSCIVAKYQKCTAEHLMEIAEKFQKTNASEVTLDEMDESKLKQILEDLCLVEVEVQDYSPYPIHMTKPLKTYYFNVQGTFLDLEPEQLVSRFKVETRHDFDVQKFLNDVDHFDPSGNSYIMVSSPFNLPPFQRDLFGLVIPKWTLAIDFDQDPKEEGHFFQAFVELHDRYQKERDRSLVTPYDNFDLNADHGICWLAARGHREIAKSLSEEEQGKPNWNTTHRGKILSLLKREITRNVKPNKLHVVVLWDEGHRNLVYSLNLLLADILCINGNTGITFVCSTTAAHSDISEGSMKDLKNNYGNISMNDNICSLHVLAKFLACNLPETPRSEDDYQVPHKIYSENGSPIILPKALPQRLRQNIKGRLKIMYMNKSGKLDEESLNEERTNFYSGSQMTLIGLRGKIGIEREKMADLERGFKSLCSDKKSRVSLIVVKADRGAGTTTMCLQFLFKNHERFPCAQLIEIHRDLLSSIEKINQITNLSVLLLVDEEVANLQEFLDFKKNAEGRRNVNIIFLLIEPTVYLTSKMVQKKSPASSGKRKESQLRRFGDGALYGTSAYEEIELGKELQPKEMKELTEKLTEICSGMEEKQEKQEKLRNLMETAEYENGRMLRSFAHFSLTVFGKKFCGLQDYVMFRLELASEQQKDILAFLSLTHVFTDYALPARALARLLNKDDVVMKSEFQDVYLRELLSPPAHETDSRRISFLDVAEEILKQLSETTKVKTAGEEDVNEDKYWSFIKYVSVKMAREVLSVNIGASKIDRLSRKLFVISEYESEKFSSLIRRMKHEKLDIARDTLIELVEVFKEHDSFKAHLLAHLAKYYMIEYKNFEEARPRIENAVEISPEDALLHHIHGDIIRHQLEARKNEEQVEMNDIVFLAIESSNCFQIVRDKQPRMGHGYASDAMVRITVMEAAIKAMGSDVDKSFVDYLILMLEQWKDEGGQLTQNKRYVLSLITDAYEYLNESSIDFEYRDRLMKRFMKCIQKETELTTLCEKLKSVKQSFTGNQAWFEEVIIQTHSLLCVLEIELTKDMTPDELASRIKIIEECGSRSKLDERSMKYWFRYARLLCPPPTLEKVRKRVKQWIVPARRTGGISPHAKFYNYVVCLLTALKEPKDKEKMEKAAELVNRQHRHRSWRKEMSKVSHIEWLCPREGRHINSIDSLLHNDDLVKVEKAHSPSHQRRLGRELVKRCLLKNNVIKWEGTVKAIKSDWHGTISFKGYIDIHFVPQYVRPDRPAIGDTVNFHLSFDWNGPSAWVVTRSVDSNVQKGTRYNQESSSSNSESEEDETEGKIVASSPLHNAHIPEKSKDDEKDWEQYVGKKMTGAVVQMYSKKCYGYVSHPHLSSNLWFHMDQLTSVTCSKKAIIKFMVLEFTVETEPAGKLHAVDIRVVEDANVEKEMKEYVVHLQNLKPKLVTAKNSERSGCEMEQHAASSSRRENKTSLPVERSREEGVIIKLLKANTYGFIKPDNNLHGTTEIFFHRNNLVNKETELRVGDRVQFRVSETEKGLEANDIFVQNQYSSTKKWEHLVDHGIQEGFVTFMTSVGGSIVNQTVGGGKDYLPFHHKDILNANRLSVVNGAKVHFEVKKKGKRCIAVKVNVIDVAEPMIPSRFLNPNQVEFVPNYSPAIQYSQPHFFSSVYFGNQLDG